MTADQREQALAALDRIRALARQSGVPGGKVQKSVASDVALVRAALTPAPLPADLAEIQARADAATPGPWTHNMEAGYEDFSVDNPDGHPVARCGYGPYEGSTDAEFIAHARTDVPALVAELTAAREEITRLRMVPADAACPGCGGGGYQSSFDGSSGGTCGHCAGSGVDVDGVLIKLAELRARPTLTAEEAHVALVWAGPNPEDWYDQRDAPLVAKLRAIAEGAGS